MQIIIKHELGEFDKANEVVKKIQKALPAFVKVDAVMNIPDSLSGQVAEEVQTASELMTPYIVLEVLETV